MRIGVLGAGSIGGLIAAKLVQKGYEVLVHSRGEHGAMLAANGMKIRGHWEYEINPDDWIVSLEEVGLIPELKGWCDLAIITCKSKDTREMSKVASYVCNGPVLSLQNGLGNIEIIEAEVGPHKVAGGTTTNAVFKSNTGEITWAGNGDLIIGGRCGKQFIEILDSLNAEHTEDLNKALWEKVLLNVAINPLAAICGINNGGLLETELLNQAESTMLEAANVARIEGVDLPDNQMLVDRLHSVIQATASNQCSMLQDIKSGKETEIEFLCGEVVKRGEKYGLPTPLNAMLLSQINALR
ncbi:MAG: 2-dehydropantoate 2-reductase [Candidatus Poseidoniaceae archaeon]|jgi:2-dehydropantoate 2-reductase|nr:2-dehydropantoate 2-reductase [Candidatus Poseidoniaceae archaeon]